MLMKRITLNKELLSKLRDLQDGAFVCDENGDTIGYFALKSTAGGTVECPLSTDELMQRAAEGGGRPLDAILASLKAHS